MDVVSPILAKAGASYVINKLIDAATTYLRDQYYWKTDLQEELQNLRRLLPQIQAVVGFAEHRLTWYEASNPALMEWLRQFRNEIDEAEEVLDELEYHELEKKSDSDKSGLSRAIDACVSAAKKLWPSDDVLEGLRTCVKNLNTTASGVGNFLTLVTQTGGISSGQIQQEIIPLTNKSRITSSLPALSFKGREEEKGKIIQYLLGDSAGESEIQRSQNVHCLPLVAMGGMGKTALAQQVFDHFENAKKEHFDIKFWVCVSTDFDASSLMKKILKYPTGESESVLLEQLPVKLKEKLHSKRFLLVLDDAWNDDNWAEWEKLCTPLLYGQKGSWILLTTRSSSVVKMVSKVIGSTMEPMKLQGLSKDECRSLLYEHAFVGQNPNEFPLLKKIGEEIVEKLDGVPLLAKSIGGALNIKLEPDHWASISRSEIWKTRQDSRDEFIPALTLSYVMLPPRLKRCFSYCGIFPQDYQFKKPKLVGMWVAAGLIYSDGLEEGSDEDIANCCFDMLCNKSFFDVTRLNLYFSFHYGTGTDYYTMHDMLNGLARHVSRYECCRIVNGAPSSILDYNGIRHISISITSTDAQLHDVAKKVCKLKHLRTLWIDFYIKDSQTLDDFIRDACKSPRRIRVLIIKSDQCLESISDFVKLRFLDISVLWQPRSISLSKSICKFYFLQVLIGEGDCPTLAKDAHKLTSLRHLYEVRNDALISVAEVGKLTSLQELCFSVGTESGYRIDELMNMDNLRQLKIQRLSNVQSLEEANKVNLVKKRNLTMLELDGKFSEKEVSSNPDLDQQEVLAALRPPPTIRELFITHYYGGRLAPWMDTSSLSRLESLELYACTSLEELPSLWKLPCLKFLKLYQLNAIRSLGCHSSDQMDTQFPVLERLVFIDFPLWEEWNGANDYKWFPRLKRFVIEDCPKLKKIPDLPLSVEILRVRKLGLEALPQFYKCSNGSRTFGGFKFLEIDDCRMIVQIGSIGEEDDNLLPSSLKMLKLRMLSSLQKLYFSEGTKSDYTSSLSWLEYVELVCCDSLEVLPPLWKLPCLKFLKLYQLNAIRSLGCHSSDQMDKQFPVLEKLEFSYLPLWEEWNGANDYIWFPHLKSFEIDYCPKLKKIPDLPLSIENLKMRELGLEALPRSYKCSNGSRTFGGFQQLTSLESLEIDHCRMIVQIGSIGEEDDNLLPSSLKTLKLNSVTSLQKLCFSMGTKSDYKGGRLSPWINTSSLSWLESVELGHCKSLEMLPPLWKLPGLKFLKLSALNAIRSLGCHSSDQMDKQFPVLEKLEFSYLPLWEEWNGANDYIWFPHLKSFEIDYCPKLKKIPDLPLSIENLKMKKLGLEALPRFYKCSNGSKSFGGFQQLMSLESLEIDDCRMIVQIGSIGEEDDNLLLLPSSLKKLKLNSLTSLQKLCFSMGTKSDYKGGRPAPWTNTSSLSWLESLESVKLCHCTSLEVLPPLWKLPCLKFLNLFALDAIRSLGCHSSDQMDKQFPVLETLQFVDLRLLEEWKGADDYIWFPYLKRFEIDNCPKLKKIPDLPLSIVNFKMVELGLEALPRSYKCSNSSRTFGGFQQLTSLKSLQIYDYPIIGEENDNLLPSSLKKLKLREFPDCSKFLSLEVESRELLEDKIRKHAASSSSVFDHSASNKAALPSSPVSLKLQKSGISQESLSRRLQGLTSLEELQVSSYDHLVSLPNIEYLTALQTLDISDCKELRELESLTALVSLRILNIRGCPKLLATTFSTLQNPATTTEESATEIKKGTLPSLEELDIESIFYLSILPTPVKLKAFSVQSLIENPQMLAKFTCFPSEIEEWLLQYQESLEYLTLGGMPHLQSLPASLESFSSLKSFEIYLAQELKSMPRMPASLRELFISGCSAELKKRCLKNIGPDWPNINHIPYIEIRVKDECEDECEF